MSKRDERTTRHVAPALTRRGLTRRGLAHRGLADAGLAAALATLASLPVACGDDDGGGQAVDAQLQ